MTRIPDPPKPPPGFTGLWSSTDSDGSRTERTYVDGVATGPYRRISADGIVNREGELLDGQWHGRLVVRGSRGQVLDESMFDRGTGVFRIFTVDDRLGWEIPLRNGKRHGTVRRLCDGVIGAEEWRDDVRITIDHCMEAKQIALMLGDEDLFAEGDALRNAVAGGLTTTESLVGLLQQVRAIESRGVASAFIVRHLRGLAASIEAALGHDR
jgi:hypothetical protein